MIPAPLCACSAGGQDPLRVYGCSDSGVWRAVRPELAHLSFSLLDELARARMHAGLSWGCTFEPRDSGGLVEVTMGAARLVPLHDR